LDRLAERESLDLLRRVFTDPESFRPEVTSEGVTEAVAKEIGALALQFRTRGHDPHETAHFLMKCMFCLFAEDIGLLPGRLFQQLLTQWQSKPPELVKRLTDLFDQMRTGGAFGVEEIAYFNGGLFDESPALEMNEHEAGVLLVAAKQDWGSVEPAIFGTLFERSLDPNTRAQIGAHYTSKEDILLVVEPVVMAPLRREWAEVQEKVDTQLARRRKAKTKPTRAKADAAIEKALHGFVHRLASVRILDPACGSGNFLYVAIQQLLDLEKEVITHAARPDIGLGLFPRVRPTQLHGIEINPYAAELAQVVIWIGYLQWMRDNGFAAPRDPILEPLQTIENRDAILAFAPPEPRGPTEVVPKPRASTRVVPEPRVSTRADDSRPPKDRSDARQPRDMNVAARAKRAHRAPEPRSSSRVRAEPRDSSRAETASHAVNSSGPGPPRDMNVAARARPAPWPDADFIIGNPPFLGSKLFRQQGLDDDYIEALFTAYDLPNTSDLCCYWFERARQEIEGNPSIRAGLLATQGIRGGANRRVLERIKQTGDIFMAWSDREWVLDGAAVHVSIVGVDGRLQAERVLDGHPIGQINSDLTEGADTSSAKIIGANQNIAYMGDTKVGPFDIKLDVARTLLASPNPHGRSNADVVRPWANGLDLTRRWRSMWIVDFPPGMSLEDASLYEAPFEHVRQHVHPMRRTARSGDATGVPWWIHQRPRPEMRAALPKTRFVATPNLTKYRAFAFLSSSVLPDHQLIAFARSDDYFFGALHSSIHELWARRMGTQLREAESGFRYTPTTCFETFPLPWSPNAEPRDSSRVAPEPRDSSRAEHPFREADPSRARRRGGTYLLTWTTYGSWLPGDERGFVGRVPDGEAGHVVHNLPGEPYDADEPALRRSAGAQQKGPTVTLDGAAADVCAAAFREVSDTHGVVIHAAAVMANHVHLVVSAEDADGARLLQLFKGVASRRLGQRFGRRPGGSWWTRHGSRRLLRDERAVEQAIRYVMTQEAPLVAFDHDPRDMGGPRDMNVAARAGRAQRVPEPRVSTRAEHPSGTQDSLRAERELYDRISKAAKALNEQRERWLNPPEWIGPIAEQVDAEDDFAEVPEEARALIRQSAIMARAAKDKRLKQRTLTNLYNERPTWLRLAHEALDRAVLAAYAAVDPEGAWDEDWAEVWTETGAGQPLPDDHTLTEKRKEVDQRVLANLLRLNLARAGPAG